MAEEVAKSARPFTEGEFIKNCMLKVCDAVCPDIRQLFSNVSLSRNTVAERIDQLSTNLKEQFVGKGKDFIAYSLAVDESTDTSDIAQLSIFIRGVDSSLSITEELLALRPMHGKTSGQDLYEELHFISFHFIIFIQVKVSYIYMFFNLTCFKRLKEALKLVTKEIY